MALEGLGFALELAIELVKLAGRVILWLGQTCFQSAMAGVLEIIEFICQIRDRPPRKNDNNNKDE